MLHRIRTVVSVAPCLAGMTPAQAALRVLAATPDWAALTTELGGDRVNVYAATNAFQDVHRVEAQPCLVARARNADLVVATGAELEVGWLPVLVQESGNAHVQPGSPGYFGAGRNCACSPPLPSTAFGTTPIASSSRASRNRDPRVVRPRMKVALANGMTSNHS